MSKFKVGDRVKIIGNTERRHYFAIGAEGTVKGIFDCFVNISNEELNQEVSFRDIELINKSTIMSSIKEKFVLALTKEPQKSFRKAGITNGDDLLTEEGQTIFLSWLLTQNADKFKSEVVDVLLSEKE